MIRASSSISPTRATLSREADGARRLRSRSRSRSGACPSRSRTISTSPACRRPPPVRTSPMSPEQRRDGRGAAAGGRRAPRRQDQSRPVRDRPRRRAHALSRAAECARSRTRAGRLVFRFGRGGGARASSPSRSAPTPPARAASRPRSTISSGSSRPSARSRQRASCRPAARSTASRSSRSTVDDAYAVFDVAADAGRGRSLFAAIAIAPLAAPSAGSHGRRAGAGRPEILRRRGDARTASRRRLRRSRRLGCQIVEIPFADFYAVADLLYEGAWVAERYAAIERLSSKSHEASLHPVTRTDHSWRRAALVSRRRLQGSLRAPKRCRFGARAGDPTSVDLICVPTAPTHYTVEEVLADPIGTNSAGSGPIRISPIFSIFAVSPSRRLDGRTAGPPASRCWRGPAGTGFSRVLPEVFTARAMSRWGRQVSSMRQQLGLGPYRRKESNSPWLARIFRACRSMPN